MITALTYSRFEAMRYRRTLNTIYAECLRRTKGNEQAARRMTDRYFRRFGECLENNE